MFDTPEYDLDRSTQDAWDVFTTRLDEVLSVIDDGGVLTIGTLSGQTERSPYVRFTACGPVSTTVLHAEASSNASLDEFHRLSPIQLDALLSLGWQSPATTDTHECEDFWMNRPQEESASLAAIAVTTLRDVFGVQHPVLLSPDHLAEVLAPHTAPRELPRIYDGETIVATMPRDRTHLDELVTSELTKVLGHAPIRDSAGDLAIRVGSTMVFVRTTPDARELLLYSALVHDVEGRSRAAELLNDLNVESRYGRFALHRDRVFVTMSVLAQPFVPAHLHEAVRIMSQIADGIDDELASRLRGRTTFASDEG